MANNSELAATLDEEPYGEYFYRARITLYSILGEE
jgi:hypothetical protein